VFSIQKQLAEAKNDLQTLRVQQTHDNELRDLKVKQQHDRNVRLELIVGACMAVMSIYDIVPDYLRKLVELDAPGALNATPGTQGALNPFTGGQIIQSNGAGGLTSHAPNTVRHKAVLGSNNGTLANMIPGEVQELSNGSSAWYQPQYIADFLSEGHMQEDQNRF
jgi:hypothetical protein